MAQVTASTSGVEILKRNNRRKSFLILNTDASIACWIHQTQPSAITTGSADVKIAAGASFALNSKDDGAEQVQEQWSVVSASGAPVLAVFESFFKGTEDS